MTSSREVWSVPLESNPDVFNKFLKKLGVHGVQTVDIFSFEPEFVEFIPQPHHAVILCFPDSDEVGAVRKTTADEDISNLNDVFFMEQLFGNTCGMFALFHSLAHGKTMIDIGNGPFKKWLNKAEQLTQVERSGLLECDQDIAQIYESCASAGETESPDNVVHHFVAYVQKDGRLIEFDSLQKCPRDCGPTSEGDLIVDVGKRVQTRLESSQNISFNALALVG